MSMLPSPAAARRAQPAQSVVELALILPVFLIMLLGMFDIGRAFVFGVAVQNGAREAARLGSQAAERRAQQLVAVSFFVLAAYIAVESPRSLIGGHEPEPSWVGIGLAAFTAPTMPLLARLKRRVGQTLNSAATVKEGAQNMVCAYLSVGLLGGLLLNALAGWWWADPAAALLIAAVAIREGRESWRGAGCCDEC